MAQKKPAEQRSRLADHPWMGALFANNKPYFTKTFARIREYRKSGVQNAAPIELPSHEFFASEVLDAVRPILATVERLEWSATFLRSFPNARGYARKGITRDGWMEYHYAAFAIGYSTCRDLALLLTNEVFRIGLPHRLCSMDAILHNYWVKSTDIPAALRVIAELTKRHQEVRNLHVHRGKAPDLSVLSPLGAFPMLSSVSLIEKVDPGSIEDSDRRFVEYMFRLTADQLAKSMQAEIAEMETALTDLFDRLKREYERKYEQLVPVDWTELVANAAAQLRTKKTPPTTGNAPEGNS